jgi:hypothetical protein
METNRKNYLFKNSKISKAKIAYKISKALFNNKKSIGLGVLIKVYLI